MEAILGHRLVDEAYRAALRVQDVQWPVEHVQPRKPGREVSHQLSAVHDRAGGYVVELQEVGQCERSRVWWRDLVATTIKILEEGLGAGKYEAAAGVGVKVSSLFLQFERIRPEIVSLEDGEVLSSALRERGKEVGSHAQVLLARQQTHYFRMLLLVCLANGARAVGGAVFADDKFVGEINLLGQDAVDRLSDELLLVIGDHQDAHFGCAAHHAWHFGPDPGLAG